jgi:hypothetical protein
MTSQRDRGWAAAPGLGTAEAAGSVRWFPRCSPGLDSYQGAGAFPAPLVPLALPGYFYFDPSGEGSSMAGRSLV